jgi:hypothetical protein
LYETTNGSTFVHAFMNPLMVALAQHLALAGEEVRIDRFSTLAVR